MHPLLTLAAVSLGAGAGVRAYDNGLALTPQMGWNTWNYYGCDISEEIVLGAAQAMVDQNLTAFGYEYVIMDDCWQAPARAANGSPIADPTKFPSGVANLSAQIHNLGLKFGIYSDAGMYTCGGHFGSLGYEDIDAQTYADWGVDYLKYDNCYNEGQSGTPLISYTRYLNMSRALNATGRPILYSLCNWGEDQPWNWATTLANSWRISGDIYDNFDRYDDRCPCTSMIDCKLPGYHCAASRIIDFAAPLEQKAGRGGWNDMDMLEVGNGGMSYDEYVTHFSMWALLKSPLILGNAVTNMTNDTLSIITNDALIAANQDANASPANRIWVRNTSDGTGALSLFTTSLVNNEFAIALLNTASSNQTTDISMADVFIDQGATYANAPWTLYDLWQKNSTGQWGLEVGTVTGNISNVEIGSHQTKVWKAVSNSSDGTLLSRRRRRNRIEL